MLWNIRQRQGWRQMLKGDKFCLFVPGFFCVCQALLCLQNMSQWAAGCRVAQLASASSLGLGPHGSGTISSPSSAPHGADCKVTLSTWAAPFKL